MGIAAAIIGCVGGLCGVMGILDALDVLKDTGLTTVDWTFWFMLAGVLLLGAITLLLGRRGNEE
jgi:LPXTG-motif cell wall-anchored protein